MSIRFELVMLTPKDSNVKGVIKYIIYLEALNNEYQNFMGTFFVGN